MSVQTYGDDLPPVPPVQLAAAPLMSALDGLLADLAVGQAAVETVVFDVPEQPGWAVRFKTDIPYEHVLLWREKAQRPDGSIDELQWGTAVLLWACAGIVRGDDDVTDGGRPVTFMHQGLQRRFGASTAIDAVRRFYRNPLDVPVTATAVLAEAGYKQRPVPTKR